MDDCWPMKVLLCVVSSCVLAEFLGYWLHRLLHSGRMRVLSRVICGITFSSMDLSRTSARASPTWMRPSGELRWATSDWNGSSAPVSCLAPHSDCSGFSECG